MCKAAELEHEIVVEAGTNIALSDPAGNAGAGRMKRIILCLGIFSCFIANVNAHDAGQRQIPKSGNGTTL
jgi:hypothetical protein